MGIKVGTLEYGNTLAEFGGVIQMCGWIFTIERWNGRPWYLCGFHKGAHYSFREAGNGDNTQKILIDYVMTYMFPLLHPNYFESGWTEVQFTLEKE